MAKVQCAQAVRSPSRLKSDRIRHVHPSRAEHSWRGNRLGASQLLQLCSRLPCPCQQSWYVVSPIFASNVSSLYRVAILNVKFLEAQSQSCPPTRTKVSSASSTESHLTKRIACILPTEIQQQQQAREAQLPPKPRPSKPSRDDYESSGGDSEDDYVQQRPSSSTVGKAKKRVKRRKTATGDDGEPKAVTRKRKRKEPVEVDLSELPPEQGMSVSYSL